MQITILLLLSNYHGQLREDDGLTRIKNIAIFSYNNIKSTSTNPMQYHTNLIAMMGTLFMMNLKSQFEQALSIIKEVDFTQYKEKVKLQDVITKYLGGLISAYDMSGDPVLKTKANELGLILLNGFKAPQLFYPYINLSIKEGNYGVGDENLVGIDALNSFYLEFQRLAIITKDAKFKTLIRKQTEQLIELLAPYKESGLIPQSVDLKSQVFSGKVNFGDRGFHFHFNLVKWARIKNDYHLKLQAKVDLEGLKGLLRKGNKKLTYVVQKDSITGLDLKQMDYASFGLPALLIYSEYTGLGELASFGMQIGESLIELQKIAHNHHLVPNLIEFQTRLEPISLDKGYGLWYHYPLSLYYLSKFYAAQIYKTSCSHFLNGLEALKSHNGYFPVSDLGLGAATKLAEIPSYFYSATLKFLYFCLAESNLVNWEEWHFNNEGYMFKYN